MKQSDHELNSGSGYTIQDLPNIMNKDSQSYFCSICKLTFTSNYNLLIHLCCPHTPKPVQCSVFPSMEKNQNYNPNALSPIPQLDGPISPDNLHSPGQLYPLDSDPPPHLPDHLTQPKRVGYYLDRKKQLSRLCKDTKLQDFEITVSPIAHSVKIKCSAGFYSQVVLPSFSNISEQYRNQVDDVMIRCNKVESRVDQSGASVTGVIVFELAYTSKQNQSCIGTVTIHLHHTTRTVQLQGSSLVHDKIRSPVWFVEFFLKGVFSHHALDKAVDINNFNSAVHDLLVDHLKNVDSQDKCGGCGSLFSRKSNMSCSHCGKKFHKNCFQDKNHACPEIPPQTFPVNQSVPMPSPRTPTQVSPPTTFLQISGGTTNTITIMHSTSCSIPSPALSTANTSSTNHRSSDHNMVYTSSLTMAPNTRFTSALTLSTRCLITPVPSTTLSTTLPLSDNAGVTGMNTAASILNPFASSYNPTTLSVPCTVTTSTKSKGSQKRKQSSQPAQNLDMEYLRVELNTAKASITVLETERDDLRFKNGLLEDRVKQLDGLKKNEIFEKYFQTGQQTNLGNFQPCQAPSHPRCCHQVSHCCSHFSSPCCSANNVDSGKISASLASLRSELDALRKELKNCSCTCVINTLGSPPLTTTSSAPPNDDRPPQDTGDQPPAPLSNEGVDEYQRSSLQIFDSSVTSLDQEMEDIDPDDLLNLE